jgi:hypothetical protein
MPHAVNCIITDAHLTTYAEALPKWQGSMIVGLNFVDPNSSRLAVAHARALVRLLPDRLLESIEVGNEVDMFRRHYRRSTWDFDAYLPEFRRYVSEVRHAAPALFRRPRVRGPSLAMPVWYPRLRTYTDKFGSSAPGGAGVLNALSGHWYGLSGCGGNFVSLPLLMSEGVTAYPLLRIAELTATAAAAGLPAHLGETNTVACSGREGVSNTFGAALWAIEWLAGLARVGISRVNFHGGPAYAYTAFAVDMAAQRTADRKVARAQAAWGRYQAATAARANAGAARGWGGGDAGTQPARKGRSAAAAARPPPPPHPRTVRETNDPPISPRALYYGALFFTAAAKNGATLLDTTVHTNCWQSNGAPEARARLDSPYVTAHALRSMGNIWRVVLLNKAVPEPVERGAARLAGDVYARVVLPDDGLRAPDKTRLRVKEGRAFVQRLSPPSRGELSAVTGITWSGQTFDGSADGRIRGTKRVTSIPLEEGRFFNVLLEPASATLLTVYTEPWALSASPRPAPSGAPQASADEDGASDDSYASDPAAPALSPNVAAAAEEAEEEVELLEATPTALGGEDRAARSTVNGARRRRQLAKAAMRAVHNSSDSSSGTRTGEWAGDADEVLAAFLAGEALDMPAPTAWSAGTEAGDDEELGAGAESDGGVMGVRGPCPTAN